MLARVALVVVAFSSSPYFADSRPWSPQSTLCRYGQTGYGQGSATGGYGAQQEAYGVAASTGYDAAGYGATAAAGGAAGYGSQVSTPAQRAVQSVSVLSESSLDQLPA